MLVWNHIKLSNRLCYMCSRVEKKEIKIQVYFEQIADWVCVCASQSSCGCVSILFPNNPLLFSLSQKARMLLLIRHTLHKWPTLKSSTFTAVGLCFHGLNEHVFLKKFHPGLHVKWEAFVFSAVKVKLHFWCMALAQRPLHNQKQN